MHCFPGEQLERRSIPILTLTHYTVHMRYYSKRIHCSIRPNQTKMIERAAKLIEGTRDEAAWQLIKLFKHSHPTAFISVCHRTLASFLPLGHDHFEQGWPLKSRLHQSPRLSRSRSRTCRMGRASNNDSSMMDQASPTLCDSTPVRFARPLRAPSHLGDLTPVCSEKPQKAGTKFRSGTAKRLLKQILPSRLRTPSRERTSQSNQSDSTPGPTPRMDSDGECA